MHYRTLGECLVDLDEQQVLRPLDAVHWLIGGYHSLSVGQARGLVELAGIGGRLAFVSLDDHRFPNGIYGVSPDEYVWPLFLFDGIR